MRNKNTILYKIGEKVLFLVILILLWQLVYYAGCHVFRWWKPYAIPSPSGAIKTFWRLAGGHTLLLAVFTSLKRAIVGFFLSILAGAVMGVLITRFEYLNRNLKPFILGLQTLPSICWVPFAILWFGLNEQAILFVIVIGSAFSLATAVESAVKNVNPLYIRSARTMGAKGKDLYLKVILPASTPELISGLKQGWSFAWRALMAGEIMSTSIGLGQVLQMGRDLSDINQVVVVMIVIICIGTLVDRCIFNQLELRVRKRMGLS